MTRTPFLIVTLAGALTLCACGRRQVTVRIDPPTTRPELPAVTEAPEVPVARTKTLETSRLGAALDRFEAVPNAATLAEVKLCFAKLDGEIAELELLVAERRGIGREEANAKLNNLENYRAAETLRFKNAQSLNMIASDAPANVAGDERTGADKLEDGARDAAGDLKVAVKSVGRSLGRAVEHTGSAIKRAARE